MGTIIDLISVVILAVCFYLGFKKGFINSIMGLVSLIVAIVLAINFYSYPAEYLKENLIKPYFVDSTSETFSSLMNGGTEVIPPEKIFDDEPDALTATAERFGIDVSAIKEYYNSTVKDVIDSFNTDEISDKLSEFVVESTVDTVSNVLGFISILVVAVIFINFLLMLVNLLFKLPVLKFANKLAGGLLGLLKGTLIIVLAINLMYHLVLASGNNSDQINNESIFWSTAAVTSSTTYELADSAGLIF